MADLCMDKEGGGEVYLQVFTTCCRWPLNLHATFIWVLKVSAPMIFISNYKTKRKINRKPKTKNKIFWCWKIHWPGTMSSTPNETTSSIFGNFSILQSCFAADILQFQEKRSYRLLFRSMQAILHSLWASQLIPVRPEQLCSFVCQCDLAQALIL